ncbi:globin 1 [Apis mellifera caucasica]|uniref:Globin 1 n=1 Tax=Apis mellifera TaxID=7460 RepID=Q14SN0_APIME|nr:globin 1 [Apis mellifera]XP_026298647.1 globin 1 isoform X1 [Apis mellifera]XP_026298706.1 globin 1 isoform X1 [Apis mellifera]XP_026298734.1 globin 1 isoform X1 [Apis mellifera]XP_026298774.1 globin 1 isoform X1 [Apis mellifera]KAG6803880.1 globin 1 [Apis mellifera caucasica]KAG9437326.1 globin 1 [Apis mellifera carnica]CAJ43388.1 globin 1 [Apis mellifera]CAJ43389.1 globin 1 [Apis mellifera]|eukprot:NP_001071291.1 globin 1 [Apis mellifera]
MGTFLRFLGISSSDDNRIDQATGLTERQKKLVQNTWAVVRKDEVASGIAVMTAFFKKYPEYQRYFTAFMDTPLNELPANKRFQAHCAGVITALNNVIDFLHDPGLMEASLIGLVERHKKRGQTKEEFQNLKEVMLEVLRQALGKQYTPEVAEAWNKTLDMMFGKIYQVFAS